MVGTSKTQKSEARLTMDKLQPLLTKLEASHFTGTLELRFEVGQVSSATLIHFLPFSELNKELLTIEPEKEFALKG